MAVVPGPRTRPLSAARALWAALAVVLATSAGCLAAPAAPDAGSGAGSICGNGASFRDTFDEASLDPGLWNVTYGGLSGNDITVSGSALHIDPEAEGATLGVISAPGFRLVPGAGAAGGQVTVQLVEVPTSLAVSLYLVSGDLSSAASRYDFEMGNGQINGRGPMGVGVNPVALDQAPWLRFEDQGNGASSDGLLRWLVAPGPDGPWTELYTEGAPAEPLRLGVEVVAQAGVSGEHLVIEGINQDLGATLPWCPIDTLSSPTDPSQMLDQDAGCSHQLTADNHLLVSSGCGVFTPQAYDMTGEAVEVELTPPTQGTALVTLSLADGTHAGLARLPGQVLMVDTGIQPGLPQPTEATRFRLRPQGDQLHGEQWDGVQWQDLGSVTVDPGALSQVQVELEAQNEDIEFFGLHGEMP